VVGSGGVGDEPGCGVVFLGGGVRVGRCCVCLGCDGGGVPWSGITHGSTTAVRKMTTPHKN